MTEGFDIGLEMSGNGDALHAMLANMSHGGRIAMLGIPTEEIAIDWTQVVFNMLTLKGIYGREMYETWYQMTVMLQSGLDISPVITHRFRYDEFEAGFAAAASGDSREGAARLEGDLTTGALTTDLAARLADLRSQGLYKTEHEIEGPQADMVDVSGAGRVLNLCANNYLGLASHPEIVAAAHEALDRWGFGMASVRFICGTQALHRDLERRLSEFLGSEDTILYGSCFDANGGLFEALLGPEDAVISDELNHASIIDGIRLCKAQRLRYRNSDMDELEARLLEASGARYRLIATDGVFSMDGYVARLSEICDLAERHDALVMVDDSHAVGFVGAGRPRHARAARRDRPRGRAHRHAGQGAWAVPAEATSRRGARSSSCCASARGRTCSRTASRRRWPGPPWPRST